MRQAGCAGINIGVETGDPEVLRTEAKVGLTPERLAEVVDLMHRIGIQVHFLLMVGLPSETRESLYKTYDLIRRLRPDSIGVTILTPYPGTPLYREAREKGWLESTDWNKFGGHAAVLHTDNLSAAEMQFGRETIEKLFYLQRNAGWWKRRRLAPLAARFRRWAHGPAANITAAGTAGFPDPPSPP